MQLCLWFCRWLKWYVPALTLYTLNMASASAPFTGIHGPSAPSCYKVWFDNCCLRKGLATKYILCKSKIVEKNTTKEGRSVAQFEVVVYLGLYVWTHRCPPCSRVVQATVVAVLQAAGVWHAAGIVNLKPVCVVGHSTATKLRREKNNEPSESDLLLSTHWNPNSRARNIHPQVMGTKAVYLAQIKIPWVK